MSSTERIYKSLSKTVTIYEKLLNEVSEDTFLKNPADGSWSYSETFSHIFSSGLLSLTAIEACVDGKATDSKKPLFFLARLILFFGSLPPGKIKAPKRIAALVKKVSKTEAKELIIKFKLRLAVMVEQIHLADPNQKVEHPRLGFFNAMQWLRFIEIHTIHHTKQLNRIKKDLI
jgi:hypothetical protein